MYDINVILFCNSCRTWVQCAYDSGEPQTREHPGTPGYWYTVDAEIELESGAMCSHFEYMFQFDFDNKCETVAIQSYNITAKDMEYA